MNIKSLLFEAPIRIKKLLSLYSITGYNKDLLGHGITYQSKPVPLKSKS